MIVTYEANGSQKEFAFPFDYLKKEFVMVLVDNKILTYSKNYTIEGKKVLLKNAPSAGAFVCIKRCTTTTPLVAWNDSNILNASELNLFKTQLFHIAEELSETTTDGQGNPIIPDGTSNETLKLIDQLKEQIDTVAAQFDSKIGQTLNEVEKASENAKTVSRQLIKEHDNDANAHEEAFRKHGITDGSANVIGGEVTHSTYFQERKSDIFFASAGFFIDFDYYSTIQQAYSSNDKTVPLIYCGQYRNGCYVGKKISMSEFYASVRHDYCFNSDVIFKIKISNSQYLSIVMKDDNTLQTLELHQSTTFDSTGTLIDTVTNDIEWLYNATTEVYVNLLSKQLKIYQINSERSTWVEWVFNIAELPLTNNVVHSFYWFCHYDYGSRYLRNIALSTSRINKLNFRGLYPLTLGDYTDFDKEGSTEIVNTVHISETGVTASKKDSRQTYYMIQPSNDQIDPKASILGLYTNVVTKGDSATALTDILRFNKVDYEGISAVPSDVRWCCFQRIFETNPNTGAKWEISDLGKIQLGCRILGQPLE